MESLLNQSLKAAMAFFRITLLLKEFGRGVIVFSTYEPLLEALAWKVLVEDEAERGRQKLLFIEHLLKCRHFTPFILFNLDNHLK